MIDEPDEHECVTNIENVLIQMKIQLERTSEPVDYKNVVSNIETEVDAYLAKFYRYHGV